MPGTEIGPRQSGTTETRKSGPLIKWLVGHGIVSPKAAARSRRKMTRRDQAQALHATKLKVSQGLGLFAKKKAREKAARYGR